jgi:hypothetical protein
MTVPRRRLGLPPMFSLLAVVAVTAWFFLSASVAQADTRRISDGNDVSGRLDIRRASHGHADARLVHKISTFGTWGNRLVRRSGTNAFALDISTDGDSRPERIVLIYSRSGRMIADVFRFSGGNLTLIGSASASRPNARTVRVSIRRSRLGDPGRYRWRAHSQFKRAGACSNFCLDSAPNRGRVLHDI